MNEIGNEQQYYIINYMVKALKQYGESNKDIFPKECESPLVEN